VADIIRHDTVQDIDYDFILSLSETSKLFTIRTPTSTYVSRTVVLAVGGGEPLVPAPFPQTLPASASHALNLASGNTLMPSSLQQKIHQQYPTNVLVIGGGLTSAQVADCLIRKGVKKVWLLMRGAWKIKPFDVDLEWMGKWRNQQKAAFWSADDLEGKSCISV
jgi:lysine/ornithine N-monooxygenase